MMKEERKASLVAAAFGSVAIGGFWLARPTPEKGGLKIVEQRNLPPQGIGLDRDAAVLFRVKVPAALRDAREDNLPISFRLVDDRGRVYPLANMADPQYSTALKLQRGYSVAPQNPRLEATVDGKTYAPVDVRDVPAPEKIELAPRPHPQLALVSRGEFALDVEARGTIPRNERWRIAARRTPFVNGLQSIAELPSFQRRWPTHRMSIPFAEQAGAVEVDFMRYRMKEVSEIITIPNLRLQKRFGGTALIVDDKTVIKNGLGAQIFLPRQYSGPHRPIRRGDPKIGLANLTLIAPWMKGNEIDGSSLRSGRPPQLQLLSPAPETLGLREIHIGSGLLRAKHEPNRPLVEGTFTAKARVTFYRPILIEQTRATLPIERGDPLPRELPDSLSGPRNR